jgi:protein TIF31
MSHFFCYVHLHKLVAHQVGVALAARDYDFEAKEPFQITDILDLQAVVKHSTPVCSDARDLLESGKLRLAQVSIPPVFLLSSSTLVLVMMVSASLHYGRQLALW